MGLTRLGPTYRRPGFRCRTRIGETLVAVVIAATFHMHATKVKNPVTTYFILNMSVGGQDLLVLAKALLLLGSVCTIYLFLPPFSSQTTKNSTFHY